MDGVIVATILRDLVIVLVVVVVDSETPDWEVYFVKQNSSVKADGCAALTYCRTMTMTKKATSFILNKC